MTFKAFATAAALSTLMMGSSAFAQSAPAGVDPACMMKNADGTEAVDTTKCPDGKTVATTPAAPAASNDTTTAPADTTASTTPATKSDLFVTPDTLKGANLITASDFVGKRIYSKAGDDIGEVNDFVVTNDGKVNGVILGVGGFLGIGEKDVLVSMNAIEFVKDGDNTKLVVDATKDVLKAAPAYDRKARTYM